MSVCIDIPACVELKPGIEHNKKVLRIDAINKCDYDLIVYLHIKNRQGQILQSLSVDVKASEKKQIEINLDEVKDITISGEWGLKGTTLKLPLKEIAPATTIDT